MRDNDGRKLDHATLEAMRTRAVAQIQAGAHPEDVAAALGLNRSTVFGWVARYREGGADALRAKPVPGRPPKLSGEQMRRLYTLVVGHDPRQLEFEFGLWTREMVRALIRREFAALRAEAAKSGATIFVLDEAGVRSDYHAGTTWAPIGRTPVVHSTGARHAVNLISAVTAEGALRFAAYDGTLNGAVFVDFC